MLGVIRWKFVIGNEAKNLQAFIIAVHILRFMPWRGVRKLDIVFSFSE